MTKLAWMVLAGMASGGCVLPEDTAATEAAAEADRHGGDCTWDQWGQSASHDGSTCARGQPARRTLAELTFDPFVPQETAETFDLLFVHYQVPLTDDDDGVYMMAKTGTYISCDPPGSGEPFPCGIDNPQTQQIWNEQKLRWHHGRLEPVWTFETDWKPFPVFLWQPMFQPTLAGAFIYIPGAGGTVWQVSRRHGTAVRRINPFPAIDPDTYVSGGITGDDWGNVYWNVIHLDPATGLHRGELIKARPDGSTRVFSYDAIPGAPAPSDLCYYNFFFESPRPAFPWPPENLPDGSPHLPPQFPCFSQRPGVNVTPAVGRDGTIYTASTAAFNTSYSFLIALRPDLSVKWARSLRDLVNDGCGVLVPYGTTRFECRAGATVGVDPFTNLPPALGVDDAASSSPVALPDGGVLYGAVDNYNGGRGHLVKLDRDGALAGTFDFGWDVTPAIYEHDHTYSIIIKDNFYDTDGPFKITQLSADLVPEWSFVNTSTQWCARLPDGTVSCSDTDPNGDTHPNGFEWCINAPAVDRDGTVYATAEDGHFYAIGQGGTQKARVFLNIALGAAYTPLALDDRGRIYALNNGSLAVLGR